AARIMEKATDFTRKVLEPIPHIFSGSNDAVPQALQNVTACGHFPLLSILEEVPDVARKVLEPVPNILSCCGDSIPQALENLVTGVIEPGLGILQKVPHIAGQIGEEVPHSFGACGDAVDQAVHCGFASLEQCASQKAKSLTQEHGEILNDLEQFRSGALGEIHEAVPGVLGNVSQHGAEAGKA